MSKRPTFGKFGLISRAKSLSIVSTGVVRLLDLYMEKKMKTIAVGIIGAGMAIAAAWLNTNDMGAGALWLGVFTCFLTALN